MIQSDHKAEFKNQIIKLYFEIYSTGDSSQKVNNDELNTLLTQSYDYGNVLVDVVQSEVQAVLLSFPLKYDNLFSLETQVGFLNESIYVAEVMVKEPYRRLGKAKNLLNKHFEICAPKYHYSVIRVWAENYNALNLYEKLNYHPMGFIEQGKIKPDGTEFTMKKNYLCKIL